MLGVECDFYDFITRVIKNEFYGILLASRGLKHIGL